MNAFMPWVGGKRALREQIVSMFPVFYERYIEVFGGAGWVLFHKNPGNDFEVYNDYMWEKKSSGPGIGKRQKRRG